MTRFVHDPVQISVGIWTEEDEEKNEDEELVDDNDNFSDNFEEEKDEEEAISKIFFAADSRLSHLKFCA